MRRPRTSIIARVALMLAALAAASTVTGCSSGFANVNRAPASFDRAGERVLVRMLTKSELDGFADRYIAESARADFIASKDAAFANFEPAAAPTDEEPMANLESFSLATIGAALAGVGIDFLAKELEIEAQRYQMQYRGIHYNDAFWRDGEQAFAGFEIIRWTSQFPEPGTQDASARPASRFVCGLVPSRYDSRIMLLRPIFIEVNSTKAKLPRAGDDTFSVQFDIQLIAAVPSELGLTEAILTTTKWSVGGLDLDRGAGNYRTFHDSSGYREEFTAGWFRTIPAPEPGEDGGPFTLVAAVTETASTRAPEYIEGTAGYLRENRDGIASSVGATIESHVQPDFVP